MLLKHVCPGHDAMAGGISAEYLRYVATEKWGRPYLTEEEMEMYRELYAGLQKPKKEMPFWMRKAE